MPTALMPEAALEASFRRAVRLAGGLIFKLAPTERGIPDRLVVFPGGAMYLVELKTEVGKLSPIQQAWHLNLRQRTGVEVHTIYGYHEMKVWVAQHSFAQVDAELDRETEARFSPAKAQRLAAQQEAVENAATAPADPKAARTPKHRHWTPQEVARILAEDRPSDKELSAELGRSLSAIQTKRVALARAAGRPPREGDYRAGARRRQRSPQAV